MDEIKTENAADLQQAAEVAPAELPKPKEEKLFTQEEVNKIIGKRLAKIKTEETAAAGEAAASLAEREQALVAREAKLSCREYVMEKGYPADLMDILDTSDIEAFKEKADRLAESYRTAFKGYPSVKDYGEVTKRSNENEAIKKAFLSKGKHKPIERY